MVSRGAGSIRCAPSQNARDVQHFLPQRQPAPSACSLTPRSSRAPTACYAGPAGGTRYIFASPGLASCRRRPLSSNVRLHTKTSMHLLLVATLRTCRLPRTARRGRRAPSSSQVTCSHLRALWFSALRAIHDASGRQAHSHFNPAMASFIQKATAVSGTSTRSVAERVASAALRRRMQQMFSTFYRSVSLHQARAA